MVAIKGCRKAENKREGGRNLEGAEKKTSKERASATRERETRERTVVKKDLLSQDFCEWKLQSSANIAAMQFLHAQSPLTSSSSVSVLASVLIFLCSFLLEFSTVSSAALSYRYSPVGGRLTFVKSEPSVAEPVVQVSPMVLQEYFLRLR